MLVQSFQLAGLHAPTCSMQASYRARARQHSHDLFTLPVLRFLHCSLLCFTASVPKKSLTGLKRYALVAHPHGSAEIRVRSEESIAEALRAVLQHIKKRIVNEPTV